MASSSILTTASTARSEKFVRRSKDDPERPRFVQTVTGKGISLHCSGCWRARKAQGNHGQKSEGVPVLNRTNGSVTSALSLPSQTAEQAPVHGRTGILAPLALLALVVISLALWLAPMLSRRTSAAPPLRNIAVLPLDNLTGDASQGYFVDGMTEQLITDLAQVSALRVTSRTSVMRYKGTEESAGRLHAN